MASFQQEFVFKIVDKAVVPEEKSKPNRAIISILGLILGVIFSVLFIFLKHYFKATKES
ncbi:GNVR domain-containing protein [Motilimonas sp. 1_MG-2023]|uniref:GNVR domain-containing protein n=1 Tax=Motilimonas sp. 1_MG-2023 TaxID=3062672 RepID=UPI0034DEA3ED